MQETTETNCSHMNFFAIWQRRGGFTCFQVKRNRWRRFSKPAATLERSFCACEKRNNKTIHSFKWYPLCVWMNYASELFSKLLVNYWWTMCELCRANCIGEPHLYKEYKGLLGANYANRAHLVSVGKLSRKTTSRAELSTKTKHNVKSFSKSRSYSPLRLLAPTNKVTK